MAAQKQTKSSKKADTAEATESQQTQPSEPAPKKRGKLVLIAGVLVVLAAGGGGGFYFMQSAHSTSGPAAPPPPKPALFVPLETFTVNLLSEPSQMQFLQTGVTLKISEKSWVELVKDRLPEVRNRMLMVLSAKRGSELLSASGKEKLAGELSDAIRNVIAPASGVPAPAAAEAGAKDAHGAAKASAEAAKPAEPAATTAAKPAAEDPNKPTLEVLFTSFIIQ